MDLFSPPNSFVMDPYAGTMYVLLACIESIVRVSVSKATSTATAGKWVDVENLRLQVLVWMTCKSVLNLNYILKQPRSPFLQHSPPKATWITQQTRAEISGSEMLKSFLYLVPRELQSEWRIVHWGSVLVPTWNFSLMELQLVLPTSRHLLQTAPVIYSHAAYTVAIFHHLKHPRSFLS